MKAVGSPRALAAHNHKRWTLMDQWTECGVVTPAPKMRKIEVSYLRRWSEHNRQRKTMS